MEMDPFFVENGLKNMAGGNAAQRWKGNSHTTNRHKRHAKDKRSDSGYHRPSTKQWHRNSIRTVSFD